MSILNGSIHMPDNPSIRSWSSKLAQLTLGERGPPHRSPPGVDGGASGEEFRTGRENFRPAGGRSRDGLRRLRRLGVGSDAAACGARLVTTTAERQRVGQARWARTLWACWCW
uniref:Uncharacterized protein n=1 Tax=Zea mays TaxID=4577 RepID=A0A804RJJ2_MAIZE